MCNPSQLPAVGLEYLTIPSSLRDIFGLVGARIKSTPVPVDAKSFWLPKWCSPPPPRVRAFMTSPKVGRGAKGPPEPVRAVSPRLMLTEERWSRVIPAARNSQGAARALLLGVASARELTPFSPTSRPTVPLLPPGRPPSTLPHPWPLPPPLPPPSLFRRSLHPSPPGSLAGRLPAPGNSPRSSSPYPSFGSSQGTPPPPSFGPS